MTSPKSCPRCDTSLAGGEKVCPQCRLALIGASLVGRPIEKSVCPICKIPVYEAALSEFPILHCAECKGVGVKRESMMKLQAYGPKEIKTGAEEKTYKRSAFFETRQRPPFLICPFCKKRMKSVSLSKMNVDLCESCDSIWLEDSRMEDFNDLLGPYKWKVSREKK
ncbi:MAG: zf-TFIIB domain-containing protein [bacterium]